EVRQVPRGCNASAVTTPTPITDRPTTQVGAAQQTTHVMVVAAAPARSAPLPAAAAAATRSNSPHLPARSSTRLGARSTEITSTTAAFAGISTKLHSATPPRPNA